MWKPLEIGEVVAERRLVVRSRRGSVRAVVVRFGRPVRSPAKRDPWWSPVEIVGVGRTRLIAAAGEDSVQALILALRAADVEFAGVLKRIGARVEWLSDVERPIFFHTFMIDMYEDAVVNLLAALRKALAVIEGAPNIRQWRKAVVELRRTEASRGFARHGRGRQRSRLTGR